MYPYYSFHRQAFFSLKWCVLLFRKDDNYRTAYSFAYTRWVLDYLRDTHDNSKHSVWANRVNSVEVILLRSVFIPIPKKGDTTQCSNHRTIALISHTSKIMLKIVQNRLKVLADREISTVQAAFRRGRSTRDQIVNLRWIMETARERKKTVHICFIDYSKAFDCVDHDLMWQYLLHMGAPVHIVSLLQALYKGQ